MRTFVVKLTHTIMASPKTFTIKESEKEIRLLMGKSAPMLVKRLHALLIFKQQEKEGISKREVAIKTGANHNSIQTWRTAYINGGIALLLNHQKVGYKPSIITAEQEEALKEHLHQPDNGTVGFVELLAWFNQRFNTKINYKTFHGFVVRKFNAKIKKARKTHIKKDVTAVEAFKKTSLHNVGKSSGKRKNNIKP
jgi:transposase